MNSLILQTVSKYLLPLLLLFSLFVLLRGHNEPGGGFLGGLVAAAGWSLRALGENVVSARETLRLNPDTIAATGLAIAVASSVLSLFADTPYLTGQWLEIGVADGAKLGTPLLFDIGVYLLVFGSASSLVFAMVEAEGET